MKLQAKRAKDGRSGEYVQARNIPSEKAQNASNVVLASFRNAADALLDMTELMAKRPHIQEATIRSYLSLKNLYGNMMGELEEIGIVLQVIERRVLDVGKDS